MPDKLLSLAEVQERIAYFEERLNDPLCVDYMVRQHVKEKLEALCTAEEALEFIRRIVQEANRLKAIPTENFKFTSFPDAFEAEARRLVGDSK